MSNILKSDLEEALSKYSYKYEIAENFNISVAEVNKLVENFGLKFKNKSDKRFDYLSKKYTKQWFVEAYCNRDINFGQLSKETGLSISDLELLRKRYDLKYKRFKYRIDKDKFYNLTDPNVYYLAGLIATDGHIDKFANRVEIALVGDSEKKFVE